jgi:hypothetical protein
LNEASGLSPSNQHYELHASVKPASLVFLLLTAAWLSAQSRWDGGGDGTHWQDSLNWSDDRLPPESAVVIFQEINATVTGSEVTVAGIELHRDAIVRLDLDVNVVPVTDAPGAISVGERCTLTLGSKSRDGVVRLRGSGSGFAIVSFAGSAAARTEIAPRTDVYITQFDRAVYLDDSTSTFVNHGFISLDATVKTGFRVEGMLENYGRLEAIRVANDIIVVPDSGQVINHATGSIYGLEMGDDGIELTGVGSFLNNGEISLTSSETAQSANNCLNIGQTGKAATFINNSDGLILNGGGGREARPLVVHPNGLFVNLGRASVLGGSEGISVFVEGTARIDTNSVLDLNGGRIVVAESGRLRNDGLLLSRFVRGGVTSTGVATNHGFYAYTRDTVFASGTGTMRDRGLSLSAGQPTLSTSISANGGCSVQIVAAPYRFFTDDGTDIGVTSSTGELTFPDNSVASLPVILHTTLPGIEIEITDLCTDALDLNAVPPSPGHRALSVYPTLLVPGQSVRVDLTSFPSQPCEVSLFDVSGRRISRATLPGGSTSDYFFPPLSSGLYLLHLSSGGRNYLSRVRVR